MECPYCDTQELLTEHDLTIHLLKEHPDKVLTGDLFRNITQTSNAQARMSTLMNVAAVLTNISYQGHITLDDVLITYRNFLKELMSLR